MVGSVCTLPRALSPWNQEGQPGALFPQGRESDMPAWDASLPLRLMTDSCVSCTSAVADSGTWPGRRAAHADGALRQATSPLGAERLRGTVSCAGRYSRVIPCGLSISSALLPSRTSIKRRPCPVSRRCQGPSSIITANLDERTTATVGYLPASWCCDRPFIGVRAPPR